MTTDHPGEDSTAKADSPGSGRFPQTCQPHRRHQTNLDVHRQKNAARVQQGPMPGRRRRPDLLRGALTLPRPAGAGIPPRNFRPARKDHGGAP